MNNIKALTDGISLQDLATMVSATPCGDPILYKRF